jgi:hypothetical protein
MTAASRLGGLAVARLPGNGHRAWPPWVMAAALLGETWPTFWLRLDHAYIQTCDRSRRIAAMPAVADELATIRSPACQGIAMAFQLAPAFTVFSTPRP